MRTLKTTVDDSLYDLVDQLAGLSGMSKSEALRVIIRHGVLTTVGQIEKLVNWSKNRRSFESTLSR